SGQLGRMACKPETVRVSDARPPIEPTDAHFKIAQRKMARTDWCAIPAGLLDNDRDMRELPGRAVRPALRLFWEQWSHGSIPADPKAAARLVGLPLPGVREAMTLFTDIVDGG